MNVWIAAARLRTLPLAFSSIFLGSLMAASEGSFNWTILILALLTTLSYQVLSNYANDLGDGLKGTDANRKGEKRAVASGSISIPQMRGAVRIFFIISVLLGTSLSFYAFYPDSIQLSIIFSVLGLLACLAATNYTMGKRAYGYFGLGDLFVLIFFGFVGVVGSYFLFTAHLNFLTFLPAASLGLLAVSVLNLNNLRDREDDQKVSKITLAVIFGDKGAKIYQAALVVLAFDFAFVYNMYSGGDLIKNLYLISFVPLFINLFKAMNTQEPMKMDKLLKPQALATLLFAILFGLGRYYAG